MTCGADRSIKLYDPYNTPAGTGPVATWLGTNAFTSISMHRKESRFAVASGVISIFDLERHNAPPEVLSWPGEKRARTITSKRVY